MFIADLPADGQTLSIQWACCYGISLGPSHITQKREHSGDPVVVAQVAVNSQCFFKEALRSGVLGLNRGDSSCGNKDFGSSGQINGRPLLLQRPGFPGGDSRLHQLQPRPVAKPTGPRPGFKLEEFIVYPAHGVGQIVGIEEQEVAGFKLELYVISFAKDKMTLKVPTPKVVSVGMRKLAEPALVQKALEVLTGRARIKRTMWSRRAQEYEAKINSGDIIAIAEVIRDLYRSEAQPEQSYSERQLYEAALDRMAREIGAVEKLTETETLKLIETELQKGPRRGVKPEGESEGEGEAEPEGEVEEAAA